MKICPKCNKENSDNAKFCDRCGNSFFKKCPQCGADNSLIAQFCNQCGKKLSLDDGKKIFNGHACVDLGLPSGTLWATCNVGAEKPEEYGDAFSWGETEPRDIYGVGCYKYGGRHLTDVTKYNTKQENGIVDNLTRLNATDDAANANWGTVWQMPTPEDIDELILNCKWYWTTLNDVQGCEVKGYNGNSIFIPTAGYKQGFEEHKDVGYYWTNSLYRKGPFIAWCLHISSQKIFRNTYFRVGGLYIRPVYHTQLIITNETQEDTPPKIIPIVCRRSDFSTTLYYEADNKIGEKKDGSYDEWVSSNRIATNSISNVFVNGKGKIVLPDDNTRIAEKLFFNLAYLRAVTIPNSVTIIEKCAFANCNNLKTVIIPNSVKKINDLAFGRCSSLVSITIPNSVTEIGFGAFEDCSSLVSISIPDSVKVIDACTFEGCSSLVSITIPNSVTEIGDKAFYGCSGLASITIPYSVTSIGKDAFSKCSGLSTITIGNGNTSIGDNEFGYNKCSVFDDCNSLKEIVIPRGTKENLKKLLNVNLWNKLIEGEVSHIIYYEATEIIKSEWIDKNAVSHEFENGKGKIELKDSVTEIGENAFDGCRVLISVVIPDSITKIGVSAFGWCTKLTTINIPDSVTSIGNWAFGYCNKLPMEIKERIMKLNKNAFIAEMRG